MGTEVELKLAVKSGDLERVARAPLRGAAPADPPRLLYTVYYDTPELALWERGLTLRLRHEGARRKGTATPRAGDWVQTVKGGGDVNAGLHRRIEAESPVPGQAVDLARISDPKLAAVVRRIARGATLQPVFSAEFTRVKRMVRPAAGIEIEVALDHGALRSRSARVPVSEIELELKAGPASSLFELALEIHDRVAVSVENCSKAERGFALVRPVRAAAVRTALPAVRRGMGAADGCRTILSSCLDHLQANRDGMLRESDPEYVRQVRIALRRTRSALRVFQPLLPPEEIEPIRAELRWFARALGPARDWDVFIAGTLNPVVTQLPGHHGLLALERASNRKRESAYRTARRAAVSRRYQRLLLSTGALLAVQPAPMAAGPPLRTHAVAVLGECYRRVRKRGQHLAGLGVPDLHQLRIAVKRLHYAGSFFAPLLEGASARPLLSAVSELRDTLGAINDAATAPQLIEAAARGVRAPLLRQARALVRNWAAAALADHRRRLAAAWKAFRCCDRYWQ